MDALKGTWTQFPSSYLRLIAMGIDSYNLAAHLGNLEADSYSGATGSLSLTTDQRIKRKLICAKFIDGQPEISGFTSENAGPTHDKVQPDNHAVY